MPQYGRCSSRTLPAAALVSPGASARLLSELVPVAGVALVVAVGGGRRAPRAAALGHAAACAAAACARRARRRASGPRSWEALLAEPHAHALALQAADRAASVRLCASSARAHRCRKSRPWPRRAVRPRRCASWARPGRRGWSRTRRPPRRPACGRAPCRPCCRRRHSQAQSCSARVGLDQHRRCMCWARQLPPHAVHQAQHLPLCAALARCAPPTRALRQGCMRWARQGVHALGRATQLSSMQLSKCS